MIIEKKFDRRLFSPIVWRRNRLEIIAPLAGAGTVGALGVRHNQDRRRNAAGVAGGAAVGQGAWLTGGFTLKALGHRVENTLPEGMSRSRRTKLLKDHRKRFGYAQGELPYGNRGAEFFRSYPSELPGARYKHVLGHMAGRKGAALSLGTAAAGAGTGLLVVRTKPHNPTTFGKRLVEQERRLSPVRAAEAGVGVAGLAWGVPRVRMIGPALRMGSRTAQSPYVRQALRQTERGRVSLEAASAGPGRRVASSGFGTRLGGLVPPRLQGEAVAGAGALLLSHALPIHNTTAVAVQGW